MVDVPYIWEAYIWFGETLNQFIILREGTPQLIRGKAASFLLSTQPSAFSNDSLASNNRSRIYYYKDSDDRNAQSSGQWCYVDESRNGHEPQNIGGFESAVSHFVNRGILIGYEVDELELEERIATKNQQKIEQENMYREILAKDAERRRIEDERIRQEELASQKAKQQEEEHLAKFRRKVMRRKAIHSAALRYQCLIAKKEQERVQKRRAFQQKMKTVHLARNLHARETAIKNLIYDREITELVHFTHIDNLVSILQRGLHSRLDLAQFCDLTEVRINDFARWDGYKGGISVSISFPNYKLFYKWNHSDPRKWIVLSIKPEILWMNRCLFFPTNAASSQNKTVPNPKRGSVEALNSLFQDFIMGENRIHRSLLNIPDNMPTNPQAEVLVLNPIYPENIKSLHFFDKQVANHWLSSPSDLVPTIDLSRRFFQPRSDYRYWQQDEI